MKFFEKVFLYILVLVVIIFHIGMFTLIHVTYREQLNQAKKKAQGEAYFIVTSISNDFYSLESNNSLTYEQKESVFSSYMEYYQAQGILLNLLENNTLLYGNIPDISELNTVHNIKKETQSILIYKINGEKYIFVTSRLIEPYETYIVIYAYSLYELDAVRTRIISITFAIDVIMLLTLSVFLYVLLRRLFYPLKQLNEATTRLMEGNYKQLIPEKGADEFSLLSIRFNKMAGKIEEQVKLLKQENSNKQLLIDNIAHELRTPLTSISGYSNYIKIASLNEEQRVNALDYILSESLRLEKLSKTLLSMADIREGELEVTSINVKELMNYILFVFDSELQKKSIHFNTTYNINYMCGNKVLVESLLINLVENAIRACECSGFITIRMEQTDHLIIKVIDNGIGISSGELERIDEPFYRVDKDRSRSHGGIGLGVSLCKQIVTLHQASMRYDSTLGKGTAVIIDWYL